MILLFLISIIIFFSVIIVVLSYHSNTVICTPKNIDIDPRPESKPESGLCQFQADIGYVCPIDASIDDAYITAVQTAPNEIRNAAADAILSEWGTSLGIKNRTEANIFIDRSWPTGDPLYVLYIPAARDKESGKLIRGNEFIGCAGIDRVNFYPFISNLYVIPYHRRKGWGRKIITHALQHIKHIGFPEGRLICNANLRSWYEMNGWRVERSVGKQFVMIKNT